MSRSRTQTHLGVISDVHGDLAALREALTQFERLGIDEVVCAGDLLDWGPSPGRCIELLQERRIPCVRGNHDFLDAGGGIFDPAMFLSGKALAFIDALPRNWERTIPDRADVGAVLETAAADVLVVGHTHTPMHLSSPRGSIVNPGSILRQPPSTETIPASGTFGILELPSRRFSVHRASDGTEVGLEP